MLRRTMATADAPLFAQLDRRWFFPVLCALLLVPQFLNTPPNRNAWVIRPGLPLITSGDEPHYLTLLHSLIEDGDFDVKNNYDEAARGGRQSGIRRAGRPQTDRHVGFYAGEVFVGQPGPPPVTPPPELLPPPGHPEYSTHPPGLPLFLAAVLWPLAGSPQLESWALLTSWAVTCLGAWYFRALLEHLGAGRGRANAVTALLFLTTPAWHYSRTLFSEPYLLASVAIGYSVVLTARPSDWGRILAGGVVLGIGLLMKPPFALCAAPLGVHLLLQRRYAATAIFAAPLVTAVVATLVYQHLFFGSIWHPPQPWRSGNIWTGLRGLFLDDEHGLLIVAPAAALPLLAWPRFARTGGRPALLALAGGTAYLLLMALWLEWHGGFCYGPRLIVPVLPLLFLALAVEPWPEIPATRRRWLTLGLGLLVACSFLINLGSVIFFRMYWTGIPWTVIGRLLG